MLWLLDVQALVHGKMKVWTWIGQSMTDISKGFSSTLHKNMSDEIASSRTPCILASTQTYTIMLTK